MESKQGTGNREQGNLVLGDIVLHSTRWGKADQLLQLGASDSMQLSGNMFMM